MQRLEVSGAVRPLYGSLGVKGLRQVIPRFSMIFLRPIRIVLGVVHLTVYKR